MIPQAADTRNALGTFAGKVSNRSLLFEKMVLPKSWGHPQRFHDANRFNVLRACSGGKAFLLMASEESQQKIQRDGTSQDVKDQQRYRKSIADELAQVSVDDASLTTLCIKNSLKLLAQIERSYPNRNRTFVAKTGGRLLINMAGGVQENAGIALDRCFGLPLIPGSAAKGVSRHQALWEIKCSESPSDQKKLLRLALLIFGFGKDDVQYKKGKTNWAWSVSQNPEILTEVLSSLPTDAELKGLVSFLPASPASEKNMKIVAEGLTPHTNQSDGKEAQNLNPLTFPAVERGSQFAFALILNRRLPNQTDDSMRQVLDQAETWLKQAVTGTGIGAKTAAGYGWFTIDNDATTSYLDAARAQQEQDAKAFELKRQTAQKQAAELARKASMSDEERLIESITSLDDAAFAEKAKLVSQCQITGEEAIAFFQVLKSSAKKERRSQWKKKKPDLWGALQDAAKQLQLTLD